MKKISTIKSEWMIPLVGDYNPMITKCSGCYKDVLTGINCIGFSHTPPNIYIESNKGNTAMVIECPYCYDKYWFHADQYCIETVQTCVDLSTNRHLV